MGYTADLRKNIPENIIIVRNLCGHPDYIMKT